jgi:WD40 repeat protein
MAKLKKERRGLGDNKTEFSTAPDVQEVKRRSEGVRLANQDVRLEDPSLFNRAWTLRGVYPGKNGNQRDGSDFSGNFSLKEKVNMKYYRFLTIAISLVSASLMVLSGCKYNPTKPLWDKSSKAPAAPAIVSIDPPSEAKPGISYITIHGHNFIVAASDTVASDTTYVYFGTTAAVIVSESDTTIVVRRPNLSSDTCTIKVAPHNAIAEATVPYKIDPVIEQYGGFLQKVQLSAIAVDNSENVYVTETGNYRIHKATSATDNGFLVVGTDTAKTNGTPWGGCMGPDGNLYIMEGTSRCIDKVYLAADTVTQKWTQLPSGKFVKVGDCGPGGYIFTGGLRTDLCIVSPSAPPKVTQLTLAGSYSSEEILAVKVFNDSVYVASRAAGTTNPAKIWSHQLLTDSTIGPRQLVLDLSTTTFASDLVSGIAFSSNGAMYISTAAADPILVVDRASGKVDNFYKGIVPPYCAGLCWSKTSNYLYIISGNTAASQTWTVYRLDMGSPGGANF